MPIIAKSPVVRRIWAFVLLIFNLLACIYTLVAYRLSDTSPAVYWPAGFMALSLPVMLALHLVFCGGWLLTSPRRALFSFVVLLIGFPYWQRTFALHLTSSGLGEGSSFKVLSYNVRMFNTYAKRLGVSPRTSQEMLDWVIHNDADIKCIQELYNADTSRVFNSMRQLYRRQRHRQYATPSPDFYEGQQGYVGVVIFSRFPIIRHRRIKLDQSGINKGVYADIRIGKDTVRVFNVHLQSMSIRVEKMLQDKELRSARTDLLEIFRKLKHGFISRAEQVQILEKMIARSPYKVIVCGDLNDIPYSYTYSKLRERLKNAFEKAGNGLGFTYNDKLFFLRIDNQFFDPRLRIHQFSTHQDVGYSDHFPITATYSFK